jgi:hypothetical protein
MLKGNRGHVFTDLFHRVMLGCHPSLLIIKKGLDGVREGALCKLQSMFAWELHASAKKTEARNKALTGS